MSAEAEIDGTIQTLDPDLTIYRVFKLWHLEEALRLRCLWLFPPRDGTIRGSRSSTTANTSTIRATTRCLPREFTLSAGQQRAF